MVVVASHYNRKAPAIAGAFYFFNSMRIRYIKLECLATLLSMHPDDRPSKALSA